MNAHTRAAADAARLEMNPMLGIGLKIASVAVFVAMSTLLKAAEGVPVGQLIFFRSFFAIFAILLYLGWRGQLGGVFYPPRLQPFLARAGGCVFHVDELLRANKVAFAGGHRHQLCLTLITVILGAAILHEVVRFYRWSAVLIGLFGVMIIIWPRLTLFSAGSVGRDEAVGALAALGAAVMSAVAMMLVRRLVQTERTPTIVIYFSISASVIALVSLPFGWVVPNWSQLAMLVGAGFAGGIGQILLTECYRHAPMSTIAPFEYTSMLLGLVIGFMLFGDIPTFEMLIGSGIVMAAGGFIIYREHQLSLAPHKVNAPQAQ